MLVVELECSIKLQVAISDTGQKVRHLHYDDSLKEPFDNRHLHACKRHMTLNLAAAL